MEQWNIIKAYDYCYNVTDGTHDSPKQTEFGKYLITSKHIKDNRIDFESAYKISEDDYNKIITRSKVDQWDIIISMIGAYCGFCCIESSKQTDYAIKNVGLLKVGNELKCKWLYYYLTSPHGKQQLSKLRSGSSQPYISLGALRNLDIPVPNENTMSDIVSVLSSLDSKIELNRRINDNLEQQTQALFKSWFVDFEPFRGGKFVDSELGMIPEGWNIQPISSIFNFQEGPGIRNWQYVNNGTKFINIRCINNDIINIQNANMISDEEAQGKYAHFMLKENDIVISCSGTLGRKALVLKEYLPLCLNTSVIRFTPRINRQLGFLYGYLGSSLFLNKQIELASGSVQANFGPIHLKGMSIAIPDNNVLNQFSDIVNSIIQKKKNIISESLRLTNLRDSILPKLMSGKIKIDKLNS